MTKKSTLMQALQKDIAKEERILNIHAKRKGEIKNVGLVNQFALHEFIPNKWFDWVPRVNSDIMVIGQDWGPYSALLKYVNDYRIESIKSDFDYDNFLFKTFSSRTEKFIIRSIESTYKSYYSKETSKEDWNRFFFTVAVLFTRQGKLFRGNDNFEPKASFEISYPYLARQIEIIQPKVIMPLGGMAWDAVSRYFELVHFGRTITEVIKNTAETGFILKDNTYIIPNFHPASYVDPKIMIRQFAKTWELL